MKWNIHHIIEFLHVFKQYPELWHTKHQDYNNGKVKNEVTQRLYDELVNRRLLVGMDVKQLKAKIKSIKDVLRQELNKIEKSRLSGVPAEEIYQPKLAWFKDALYLGDGLGTRNSKLSMVTDLAMALPLNISLQEQLSDVKSECMEPLEEPRFSNNYDHTPEPQRQITTKRLPLKRKASEIYTTEMSEAVQHLDKIEHNVNAEKPYDQFGKYVASELRMLEQREAILLQHEIQNCIIRSKLASLDRGVFVDASYSGSPNHSSCSNNDDAV